MQAISSYTLILLMIMFPVGESLSLPSSPATGTFPEYLCVFPNHRFRIDPVSTPASVGDSFMSCYLSRITIQPTYETL